MRLTTDMKDDLKRTILDALYADIQEELVISRNTLSKRNRDLYLQPYMKYIEQLPTELLSYSTSFVTDVYYVNPDTGQTLQENWHFYTSSPVINPSSPQNLSVRQKIHKLLAPDAKVLCDKILEIDAEKEKLDKFLQETLDGCSTRKQLMKVWPTSLHQFLPTPPPPKAKPKPKTPAKKPLPQVQAPAELATRLTKNLLNKS